MVDGYLLSQKDKQTQFGLHQNINSFVNRHLFLWQIRVSGWYATAYEYSTITFLLIALVIRNLSGVPSVVWPLKVTDLSLEHCYNAEGCTPFSLP